MASNVIAIQLVNKNYSPKLNFSSLWRCFHKEKHKTKPLALVYKEKDCEIWVAKVGSNQAADQKQEKHGMDAEGRVPNTVVPQVSHRNKERASNCIFFAAKKQMTPALPQHHHFSF